MILLIIQLVTVVVLLGGLFAIWRSTQPRASRPNPARRSKDRRSSRPAPDSQLGSGNVSSQHIQWLAHLDRMMTEQTLPPADTPGITPPDATAPPTTPAPKGNDDGNLDTDGGPTR
jgi:hypothetical protein